MGRIAGQRPVSTAEILRREMIAAGDRLLIALTVEAQFRKIKPGADWESLAKQSKECRSLIGQFAEDYAAAIDRWRTAVQESVHVTRGRRSRQGISSTFFQQFIEDGIQRFGFHR
jgi:hypothetical protein